MSIRTSFFANKLYTLPEGTQHCLNCGADYEGAYCPYCGQSHRVQRITGRSLSESFMRSVIGFQANLPRTLVDLLYRPGYLIADYLKGCRRNYSNPFGLILVLCAAYLFVNQYFLETDIRETSTQFGQSVNSQLYNTEEIDFYSQLLARKVTDSMFDNLSVFYIVMIFINTIPFWLAFRKQGIYKQQPLNIYECSVAMAFYTCISLLISVVSLPFATMEYIVAATTIDYAFMIPMFLLMVWQLFQMPFSTFIWRCLLYLIYAILFIFFCTIIFIFVVGIFVGLKAMNGETLSM